MKVWFFIHCRGDKDKGRNIFCSSTPYIFCSSTPLRRNGNGYDFDPGSGFDSFMFLRKDDDEMYDYILDKAELINPMDRTIVWEADL